MKKSSITLLVAALCFSGSAQKVVDSMVYDKGMEWQVFSGDGQVKAFAVQGTQLWMSVADHVTLLDSKSGKMAKFMKLGNASAENVPSIVVDNNGTVWFATAEGVAARKSESFVNYTTAEGLADNQVNKLFASSDGKVWAGTQNGVSSFSNGAWKSYQTELVGPIVTALTEDHRGALWIGTNKGISVLHQGAFQNHTMKNGMSWNAVKALTADRLKKQVWAAVGESDINRFDGTSWSTYMDIQPGITSILSDTQSRIWFGSLTGIIKFNGDEWITDAKKVGIPAAMVTDMYRDNAGNLWFAFENGVIFLNNPYPF